MSSASISTAGPAKSLGCPTASASWGARSLHACCVAASDLPARKADATASSRGRRGPSVASYRLCHAAASAVRPKTGAGALSRLVSGAEVA